MRRFLGDAGRGGCGSAPVDAFFDKVTVNDADNVRRLNGLALLNTLRAAVHTVADFSKISG